MIIFQVLLLILLPFLLILFGLLLIVIYQDVRGRFSQSYKAAISVPGDKMYFILGNIYGMIFLNSEGGFTFARRKALLFKKSWALWYQGNLVYNIIRASDAEMILNNTKHINKSMIYNFLIPFLGTGLLCSNGKKWVQRRRILTPVFHFNILQQFFNVFKSRSDDLVEEIKDFTNSKNGTELQHLLSKFTLTTLCETTMGVDLNSMDNPKVYQNSVYEIGEEIVYRVFRPWLHGNFVYFLSGRKHKFDRLVKPILEFTKGVIQQRRTIFDKEKNKINFNHKNNMENIYTTNKTRYAFLDTLLAAQACGEDMNDEGIREEVDTFMFEGHDTTATGLMFVLLLLSHHPEAQEKIYEEIKIMREEVGDGELKPKHYNSMKYFDLVLKESMRIYPPVSFIARECTEDVVNSDGVIFPAGTQFNIHIYDIHRDPKYFPDPEKFDPDRFLPENSADRHLYTYVPFSAGPRNCIGQKFAQLEMKVVLTEILWNFFITPITKREEIRMVVDMVLRTTNPIRVKFNLREHAHISLGQVKNYDTIYSSLI